MDGRVMNLRRIRPTRCRVASGKRLAGNLRSNGNGDVKMFSVARRFVRHAERPPQLPATLTDMKAEKKASGIMLAVLVSVNERGV